MPNWCSNFLNISVETKEQLDQVTQKLGESLTFDSMYPTPDILKKINGRNRNDATFYCWNTLVNTGLTTDASVFYLQRLKNGMVDTRNGKTIPLETYLKEEFSDIPSDVQQQFLKEVQEELGKPVSTLSEAVTGILEAGDGFVFSNDWHNLHWGTKWDIEPTSFDENSDTSLTVYFETAWAPPENFLKYASQQLPDAEFELTYCEPGNDVYGRMHFKNGEVREDDVAQEEIMEFFGFADEEEEDDGTSRPVA